MYVLVVDDNLLSCTRLITQLRAVGWSAGAVGAGRALAAMHERRPDAVVVNLAATTQDPVGLIQTLKADLDLSSVPVLGFCGHKERARREAAIQAGCDQVVSNAAVAANLPALVGELIA